MSDRIGLAWRPAWAVGLYQHAQRIDVLEFLADDWLSASASAWQTVQAWAALVPLHLHGTTLGLASADGVDAQRLRAWARLVAAVKPARWSEHLCMVRAGGVELGHLCAVPRTLGALAALRRNVALAADVVGQPPLLENVAALGTPPGSALDESAFLAAAWQIADGLFDVHNWYASACNQGWNAHAGLDTVPWSKVRALHIAGGRPWRGRILDDHRHRVPEAVWNLLEAIGQRVTHALDVIIEYDADLPHLDIAFEEVAEARRRLRRGREHPCLLSAQPQEIAGTAMSGADADADRALQAALARALCDERLRDELRSDPAATAQRLGAAQIAAFPIDHHGMELSAASFAAKRAHKQR